MSCDRAENSSLIGIIRDTVLNSVGRGLDDPTFSIFIIAARKTKR
jgi:hypothetical protein